MKTGWENALLEFVPEKWVFSSFDVAQLYRDTGALERGSWIITGKIINNKQYTWNYLFFTINLTLTYPPNAMTCFFRNYLNWEESEKKFAFLLDYQNKNTPLLPEIRLLLKKPFLSFVDRSTMKYLYFMVVLSLIAK